LLQSVVERVGKATHTYICIHGKRRASCHVSKLLYQVPYTLYNLFLRFYPTTKVQKHKFILRFWVLEKKLICAFGFHRYLLLSQKSYLFLYMIFTCWTKIAVVYYFFIYYLQFELPFLSSYLSVLVVSVRIVVSKTIIHKYTHHPHTRFCSTILSTSCWVLSINIHTYVLRFPHTAAVTVAVVVALK